MISASDADTLIRTHLPGYPTQSLPIDQAAGAILRQPIVAERDQPPFDRVTMDGIAIRFDDLAVAGRAGGKPAMDKRYFTVAALQAAGMPPMALTDAGSCIEVMTGAVMPHGCDTVIPVEQTQRDETGLAVAADYQPQRGQFIHRRGSDCRAGDPLIDVGARLRAPEMAVIAANGYAHVSVTTVPRISILATGDELVNVDAPVLEWQIRRSNDRALATMLASRGLNDVQIGHVSDDRDALKAAIAERLYARDVLILSGGVSMGQRDYVPDVLHELGVERVFHKIAQRPGKPIWFGIGPRGQAVFALPGNPVSALVCGIRFVLPGVLAAMGLRAKPPAHVALATAIDFSAPLTYFVPVQLQPDSVGLPTATLLPPQTSGDFSALTQTDGFVELPATMSHFPAGFVVTYYPW